MKLKEELGKVFRTIYCYQWALKYYDINYNTHYAINYITDVMNYMATGSQEESCLLAQKEQLDELDDGIVLAESMMYNTVELVDDLYAKMDEVDNKASKNRII